MRVIKCVAAVGSSRIIRQFASPQRDSGSSVCVLEICRADCARGPQGGPPFPVSV